MNIPRKDERAMKRALKRLAAKFLEALIDDPDVRLGLPPDAKQHYTGEVARRICQTVIEELKGKGA